MIQRGLSRTISGISCSFFSPSKLWLICRILSDSKRLITFGNWIVFCLATSDVCLNVAFVTWINIASESLVLKLAGDFNTIPSHSRLLPGFSFIFPMPSIEIRRTPSLGPVTLPMTGLGNKKTQESSHVNSNHKLLFIWTHVLRNDWLIFSECADNWYFTPCLQIDTFPAASLQLPQVFVDSSKNVSFRFIQSIPRWRNHPPLIVLVNWSRGTG